MVMEDLRAALGRLSFLTVALEFDKPFLAPLVFPFLSIFPAGDTRVVQLYVRLVMSHLAGRIERRRSYPSAEARHKIGDAFRVHASARGMEVGI